MNSLPPQHRGAGSGMNTTFQNSAQVLSIGIFFIAHDRRADRRRCPTACRPGSSPTASAARPPNTAAHLPPVSTLFAAFLGYNPVEHLIGAQP